MYYKLDLLSTISIQISWYTLKKGKRDKSKVIGGWKGQFVYNFVTYLKLGHFCQSAHFHIYLQPFGPFNVSILIIYTGWSVIWLVHFI